MVSGTRMFSWMVSGTHKGCPYKKNKKMTFTCIGRSHGAPVVPATREEWERLRNEPWLTDMCRRIEAGDEQLKHRLPVWTPHCAGFKNNHRSIKDAEKPLQRLMLDFDEKGHSAEIMEKALQLQEEGLWTVLLVEDSVRRGTHVLIDLPAGMTAEEAQTRFSAAIGFQADGVVKDVSRCIYMVPMGHTLYMNEERLFVVDESTVGAGSARPNTSTDENTVGAGSARPDTSTDDTMDTHADDNGRANPAPTGMMNTHADGNGMMDTHADDNGRANPAPTGAQFPTAYENIPYVQLLETLEDQMGGKPELGSRNNFIFAMACHLRYVCDDNPDWIAQVLPTYGEEHEKWYNTIKSACNRAQARQMSRVIQRTLTICRQQQAENSALNTQDPALNSPPPMPEKLPPLIELLVSKTPDIYRPAVAHAVFPALGAHLWQTYFRYIDNVYHEATLMNILMAGTGAGKNCISEPVNRIMADIRESDRESMEREKQWKEDTNAKGANKDKQKRPAGLVIQEIDPDTTNAALVMRLKEAEGKFLYAKMNELDQFDALKDKKGAKNHFQIMCLAFDPGNTYGQTRASTTSVCERVCIRFNWNASTTINKGKAYFRSVLTDGPISRINFCTIPERPIGAAMPVYGTYDDAFDEALKPYIDCLKRARGKIVCRKAEELAHRLMEENADFARLSQSRVYENLSFRANVIAYLKAMVLYVAHGEVWTPEMEEFVRWSLKYDMHCKMEFFGEAIEEKEYAGIPTRKNKGPQNLLDLLPEIFTMEEAGSMRKRTGVVQGTLAQMLSNWKHRGYIEPYGETFGTENASLKRFIKTPAYLEKHPQN